MGGGGGAGRHNLWGGGGGARNYREGITGELCEGGGEVHQGKTRYTRGRAKVQCGEAVNPAGD